MMNVVVWEPRALATRIGVAQSAAHVLLFQIICIISIAAGALTTVSNAVTSRLQVSEGDSAASGAGRALSVLGGAVFVVIAGCFWAIRVPLVTNFTKDAAVVGHALEAYPIVMLCVLTYWYKAPRGAHRARRRQIRQRGVHARGRGARPRSGSSSSRTEPSPCRASGGRCCSIISRRGGNAHAVGAAGRWRQGVRVETVETTPAAPVDEEVLVYHEP